MILTQKYGRNTLSENFMTYDKSLIIQTDWHQPFRIDYQHFKPTKRKVSHNNLRLTKVNLTGKMKDLYVYFFPSDLIFLIYSFGVIPVTFLNDLKKDALELKPQYSERASSVNLENFSFFIIDLNSSTLYSFI